MITVEFIPPKEDSAWHAWVERCARTQKDHNRTYEEGRARKVTPLYGQTKGVFLAAFHGKCAYCESEIAADQHGSLDHYRPKQGVTENGKPVVSNDGLREHAGYYWLAYDWSNLLSSCVLCNEPNTKLTGGKLAGKRNEFPVRGTRAWKPGDENAEEPLLLNPCRSPNLGNHLSYNEDGFITPLSQEGRVTVELLGLNLREGLVKARARAYKQGKDAAFYYALAYVQKAEEQMIRQRTVIEGFKDGFLPYSAAGRTGVGAGFEEFDDLCAALKAEADKGLGPDS